MTPVCAAEPPVRILLTVPATDPITTAACGEALNVTGEFVTDKIGVALLIMIEPAAESVRLL